MPIELKTTEYSAWVHSVNFIDDTTNINTWVDWHLVPMSRPLINAPKMKTTIVDIPGADGQIDLSTVVSGKPVYNNRTGTIEFMVQNGFKWWADMFSLIMNALNGKTMKMVLDNDPEWYYEGLITIDNWKTGDHYSTITISYDVAPYKRKLSDPSTKSF